MSLSDTEDEKLPPSTFVFFSDGNTFIYEAIQELMLLLGHAP